MASILASSESLAVCVRLRTTLRLGRRSPLNDSPERTQPEYFGFRDPFQAEPFGGLFTCLKNSKAQKPRYKNGVIETYKALNIYVARMSYFSQFKVSTL